MVCIDPHAGSDRGPQEIAADAGRGDADHEAFHANLARAGVTDRVRHVRAFSGAALDEVPGAVDVLFVDGAHRFGPARADLVRWGDRVVPGGRMLVHDAWSSVGVTLALLTTTVFGRRWRYVGRDGSLAEFVRADAPTSRATRCASCASCRGSPATWWSRRSSWRACAAGPGRIERAMLPAVLARALTSLRLRALDLGDRARGRGDPLVPPRRLRGFAGDSDFVATGDELLSLARAHGGLRTDSRVLDVGCGIGRLARTLTEVLDPAAGGAYVGFDPVAPAVAWCAARYPAHFRFVHADLRNDLYNPVGAVAATDYRFPVDDGWATLVMATSVFTHLDRPEVDRYLAETRRAMGPGAVALLTFFLLDDASRAALAGGRACQPFAESTGEQAIADPEVTMAAVAYDRASVLEALAQRGLEAAAVHDGNWRGGAGLSYQDLVVARAPG